MPQLRLGLAQVEIVVGDVEGNAATVRELVKESQGRGVHLVCFPEMTLTGYPAEDLVLRRSFVDANVAALEQLARDLAEDGGGDVAAVVGYLGPGPGDHPQNCAAVLWQGRVAASYAKHHLPNYGVFDEYRYFAPGERFPVLRLHGIDVGLTICEDLWQEGGPVEVAARVGLDLLVCINGSPYERGKGRFREDLCAANARTARAALAFVNQVGGQDELVFDGQSLMMSADGTLLARAPQFEEGLVVVDLDLPGAPGTRLQGGRVDAGDGTTMTVQLVVLSEHPLPGWDPAPAGIAPRMEDLEEVYTALVVGTRDYVTKNGFPSVVLGLSGGIDSALTATVAADALGPERVHTVAMPGEYSSQHSLDDAAELAARQRLAHRVVSITPMVRAYEESVALDGLARENLQARVRGTLLMALSNQEGHLVLTTGNKSELATGFSTLYGDSAGGFAPLKDVPKTLVWALARWRNERAAADGQPPPIPENSITKPPSAELAPGQLDTDRLPSYDLLDALLDDYVENDRGFAELLAAGFDRDLVERTVRMVDLAEYKRRQNPPGPKVTPKAFGRDRRLPITNRWRERGPVPPQGDYQR
jgi:NAD+ synthase (glutamine-hydrolysing)